MSSSDSESTCSYCSFEPSTTSTSITSEHEDSMSIAVHSSFSKSECVSVLPLSRQHSVSGRTIPIGPPIFSGPPTTLAERRQSKTSKYLGTLDFKSAFATNLHKLRTQEQQANQVAAGMPSDLTLTEPLEGSTDTSTRQRSSKFESAHANLILQGSRGKTSKGRGPDELRFDNLPVSPQVKELLKLSLPELATHLESYLISKSEHRAVESLQSRNEVILNLSRQLSEQLEANERLLFQLGSVRAAYASLQSRSSDYLDELVILRRQRPDVKTVQETDATVHELRQALEWLQLELRKHGSCWSLRATEGKNTSSFSDKLDNHHVNASSHTHAAMGATSHPADLGHRYLSSSPHRFATQEPSSQLELFGSGIAKPVRPAKSAARQVQICQKAIAEVHALRAKCDWLESKLKESEESRTSCQSAKGALKGFIDQQSIDMTQEKLPAVPTDLPDAKGKVSNPQGGKAWAFPSGIARSWTSPLPVSSLKRHHSPSLMRPSFGTLGAWAKSSSISGLFSVNK